ncbi:MAG: DUF4126 family protein [Janthinobacterium lividum]
MKAKKSKAAKFKKDPNWPKPAPTARFWPVLGLAALSGMRATSGPTFLSHYLSGQARPKGLAKSPFRFLQKPAVASTFKGLLGVEMVGDKSPKSSNRTAPSQLGARAASGALVGATLYKARGGNALSGALVGSLGAVASTFLTFWLRKTISERTHTHTSLVGLGEDALVIASGSAWVAAQAKK